eukprot:sb/3476119/
MGGSSESYTCTKNEGDTVLTCNPSADASSWPWSVEKGAAGVTVDITYTGTSAEKWICEVTVDDVTDTKYVYADAIGKLFRKPTEISKQPIRTRYIRPRHWLSADQEPAFPDSVGFCSLVN